DTDDNIQLLCRNCNTTKGGKGMDYLRRKILQRRTMEQMQLWREKWQRQKEKIDRLRGD
ncbi:MAG: HNH endonuclease, partial [Betaproteobacteria bacterium]|nr:HNH endonuclease [Betaproteobacteria bacterium]